MAKKLDQLVCFRFGEEGEGVRAWSYSCECVVKDSDVSPSSEARHYSAISPPQEVLDWLDGLRSSELSAHGASE